MNQSEKRRYLIEELLDEQPSYRKQIRIPAQERKQKQLLRSLMNIRQAAPITEEFEKIQDEYLQEENRSRGMVALEELQEIQPELYVWQGDITTLQVGAIVNAANSGMTGCYQPCHSCIDNCIHTYAGIQLRNYCNDLMEAQGYEEPTGQAKITPAFNLPCEYVIHTVGPIVRGALTREHEQLLASCYESCLKIAAEHQVESIAFCCISTGVFMFPNERAAQIAVETVQRWKRENKSHIRVIFNVFKDLDKELYEKLLGGRFVFREILPEEAEQAAAIEQICFPPNEACSAQMMKERVRKAPEFFLVAVDRETGKLAGFLNGLATDEEKFRDEFFTDAQMHDPSGKHVMLLGLDVLPQYRMQGLATELMRRYQQRERKNGREQLILTCLDSKVKMYEKMGFDDLGIAKSSWGGEQWHEMTATLRSVQE